MASARPAPAAPPPFPGDGVRQIQRGGADGFRISDRYRSQPPAPEPKHRLFVGLFPPPEARRSIALIRDELGGEGQVRDDRLHCTLFLLDDFIDPPPGALVARLEEALGEVRVPAPEVRMTRLHSFPNGPTELEAGVPLPGLRELHAGIARACARHGIAERTGKGTFRPHVTLAYRPASPRNGSVPPIAWVARELVLVHSHLGKGVHDPLGRWPLAEQLSLF